MKRTLLLLVVATVMGAAGCGSSGGGGTTALTHVYASGAEVDVPAGSCQIVAGPEDVARSGSMHYEVDDIGYSGTSDILEVAILSDSFFYTYQCGFTADQTLFDGDVISSSAGTITGVYADTYDFVASCGNASADCVFTLTWTATY